MQDLKHALSMILLLYCFSACSQTQDKREHLISLTNELVKSLENCDTTALLNMLDSNFTHTGQSNFRDFIKESFLEDCSVFKLIMQRHSSPDVSLIRIVKDSTQLPPANIAILPILEKADSSLNIKKCFLMLAFYPDEYFTLNSNLLKYSLVVERLRARNRNKIKMPDWLKELNNKVQ